MKNSFTSGKWLGFFYYEGQTERHRLEIDLHFAAGRIGGDGSDELGQFTVEGHFSGRQCNWVQNYEGKPASNFTGLLYDEVIDGQWHSGSQKGKFLLWLVNDESDLEPTPARILAKAGMSISIYERKET